MKADLKFDFLVDEQNNTITIRREFAAKRKLVWDCYTKSALLDQWFAPRPLTTKTRFMDFREGGHWHYAMVQVDGQEYWGRMDYQTIHPIDHYSLLAGFCDDTGTLNPAITRSGWDVTFSDVAQHTVVETVVSYASNEALQRIVNMGFKEGMTSNMERLDELLLTVS
jgi:uncharacterized protein YndB with AHSA1/START domain